MFIQLSMDRRHNAPIPDELFQSFLTWLSSFDDGDDDSLRIPLVSMLCVDAFFLGSSLNDFQKTAYQSY